MDYTNNTTSTGKLKYNELNKLLDIKGSNYINNITVDKDNTITNSNFIFRKGINY